MNRSLLGLLPALLFVPWLPGCTGNGGQEQDCYGDPLSCMDASGSDHGYVVDDIIIPEDADDAEAMGMDLDGDGEADNALGKVLATFQLQYEVDARVAAGDSILLVDVRATDLAEATDAGLWFLQGANPDPAPCVGNSCGRHLQGGASFTIDTESPDGALIHGDIAGGILSGGPGTVTLRLALSQGGEPLTLPLIGAFVATTVQEDGLVDGTLAGAVHEDDIDTAVLPAVRDVITELVELDCPYALPDCCITGTNGAFLLALLDDCSSGSSTCDCQVTLEELAENTLVQSMLRSDVDLLDNTGTYNPGLDGDNESISLAIGFTAVTASFPPP
ncbi:MAG: hypothetical protein JRJ84_04245 [Deltaproteobacteria bacterium]|nr:hypothetical protein [Deltaproteobacteria bacterium]